MSRDWTPAEIQAASEAMQRMGEPSYEEIVQSLKGTTLCGYCEYCRGGEKDGRWVCTNQRSEYCGEVTLTEAFLGCKDGHEEAPGEEDEEC